MTTSQNNVSCPRCDLGFAIPDSLVGRLITCPSCKADFQTVQAIPIKKKRKATQSNFDVFIGTMRGREEQLGHRIATPVSPELRNEGMSRLLLKLQVDSDHKHSYKPATNEG